MCQPPPEPPQPNTQPPPPQRIRTVAALLCFVSVASFAVGLPFAQAQRDALKCSTLCAGGMTSVRNFLALIGAPLVGRLSDTRGRRWALVVALLASLASGVLMATARSIAALWIALVPAALLSHQFDALKAVLADAYRSVSDDSTLAGAQGTLGMAAGLGFMGVAAGGVLSTPRAVALASCFGSVISFMLVSLLPASAISTQSAPRDGGALSSLRRLASLPSARSPPGMLLIALRTLMGLAFHVFAAVWQTSLKTRFPDFAAPDHARFMSFVGISYAIAQGLLAQPALRCMNHTTLLCTCCICLSFGRVAALFATRLDLVYLAYAPLVLALGIVNAAVAAAASRIAQPEDTGGFVGFLSAVESICGVVGPALGGLLAVVANNTTVCGLVLVLYAFAAALIYRFWSVLITSPRTHKLHKN